MRKVIGIGETILDILFRDLQPLKAVPGGSTFNCMISLGRCGVPAYFISELGNDKVGNLIRNFMEENRLSTQYIDFFNDGNSPVSLAFLDEKQNADYVFYRNFSEKRLDVDFPVIQEDDIVIFGSYFVLNPVLRERVLEFLTYARDRKAILYYDINFRNAHAHERIKLMPAFLENFELASIIRCSDEDLKNVFPGKSIDSIYQDHIAYYCKNCIITQGSDETLLKTGKGEKNYPVPVLDPVSTIGAGDNFNAGIVYSILRNGWGRERLECLNIPDWDILIDSASRFAGNVCLSLDNYVSWEFSKRLV